MKRSPIIIATIITTFILGIVGGVVKATADAGETQTVKKLQATIQAQQDLYNQTVAEANARIEQVNSQIKQVEAARVQQVAQQPTPEPVKTAVSAEQAVNLALAAIGVTDGSLSGQADLVEYSGKPAYEVRLSDGSTVYVDAGSSDILYNSVIGGPGKVIDSGGALYQAVTYMKGGQAASVEKTVYEGTPAYLVTFTNGDQVYVNLAGQVIAVIQMQTYPINYSGGGSSAGGGGSSTSTYHESDDGEHESDDD
jgi:hypothetical protein